MTKTRTFVNPGIFLKLTKQQASMIRKVEWSYKELHRLVARAFDEHAAGNLPEARILLNQALDIEIELVGDCPVLGDLSEEWGVDYERDQRKA